MLYNYRYMLTVTPLFMRKHGFTIVELLIVIVVIAILAAITIVTYNGIQQRARDQKMVAAATQVYKAISAYIIDKGEYPTVSPSCVGTGYPTDPSGLCYTSVSSLSANTALAPYLSQIPEPPMEKLTNSARGMLINTTVATPVLEYSIIGTSVCPGIGAPQATTSTDSNGDLWCRAALPLL